MKRFQKLIVEAKAGLPPWEALPAARIPAVAAALTAADIADIVGEIDRLAQEKANTPAWDGDTCDDIARAQELFATLLASAPAALQPRIETSLQGAREETRTWVTLARGQA